MTNLKNHASALLFATSAMLAISTPALAGDPPDGDKDATGTQQDDADDAEPQSSFLDRVSAFCDSVCSNSDGFRLHTYDEAFDDYCGTDDDASCDANDGGDTCADDDGDDGAACDEASTAEALCDCQDAEQNDVPAADDTPDAFDLFYGSQSGGMWGGFGE